MSSPMLNPGSNAPAAPDDAWVDEALAPLSLFVAMMSEASTASVSGSEHVESFRVERLDIALPFEMDAMLDADGRVYLAGGPPTQYTETTFMPVFHKLRLTVTGEERLAGTAEPQLAS